MLHPKAGFRPSRDPRPDAAPVGRCWTLQAKDRFANFLAVDPAMYKILIPLEQCPAGFREEPGRFSQALTLTLTLT